MWPISVLAYVFLERVRYPMDLEWCEGGILYQAYRLLHGLPIYVRGDPTWEAWLYPPAHTAALALSGLFHLDFFSGRVLSIGCFVVLCATLFRELYRHAGRSMFGVAAGALAVATVACAYPAVGQWYDLIRVDTMTMALVVVAVARVAELRSSPRRTLVTAMVLTAALFTKQTTAFFVAWCCLFAVVREPRIGLRLGLATLAMFLVVLGVLQWRTNGGLWFFTVTDPQKQPVVDAEFVDGVRRAWRYAPFIAAIPMAALLLALRAWLSARSVLWLGAFVMAFPAALLPYAKTGGYINNLIPIVALAGPVAMFLLVDVVKRGAWLGALARWGAIAGFALFVWMRPLHAHDYIPSAKLRRAADELNALVKHLDGGVVVPELTFLPAHNGHTNLHWTAMSIISAQWSHRPLDGIAGLERSGARWVILQSQGQGAFESYVRSRFRFARSIPETARVQMMTGQQLVLDELWERPPRP